MNDADGPTVVEALYKKPLDNEVVANDPIPRALDHAVSELRERAVSQEY
jgi:hypothetical protein